MAPTPDTYESRYMNAGDALVRSRKPMPWWFFLLIGVAIVLSVGSTIAGGNLVALISLPFLALAGLLLSVVRVVVTREHLHVQFGLWGPKVAIADITKIEAMTYPFMKYGGWGIRRGFDGSWAYTAPGGTGRGVRVEYRDGERQKAAFVSSEDADEIVRTVLELQGKTLTTGVRIDETGAPVEAGTRDEASATTPAGEAESARTEG